MSAKTHQFNTLKFAFRISRASLIPLWIAGMVLVGLQLVTPYQVGWLTNLFQQEGEQVEMSLISQAVVLIVLAQLTSSAIQYWQIKHLVWLKENLTRALVMELFRRVLRFPGNFFHEHEIESINTRILDDSKSTVQHISKVLVTVPVSILMVIVFSGYMISLNLFLGLCMIPLALFSGYFLVFDRQIQELNRKQRNVWEEIRVDSNEVLCGVSELRCHYAFDYGLRNLEQDFDEYNILMKRIGHWSALFEAGVPIVSTIQTSVLYWLGAMMCISGTLLSNLAGQITWGEVIQFMLVVGLFQRPVVQLAIFILSWRMARERIRRVRELLDYPVEFSANVDLELGPQTDNPALDPIEMRNVDVITATSIQILKDITVNLSTGKKIGLVGPAGCGKSTLMQLLIMGQTLSNGEIKVGERSLEDYHLWEVVRKIGYVPQKPILFNATIRENMLLGLRRPSAHSLLDENGPIDISLLPNIESVEDLDHELIRLSKQLHFDQDLLRKGLDSRNSQAEILTGLREHIATLRAELQKAKHNGVALPLEHFQLDQLLLSGTLQENLLGPFMTLPEATDDDESHELFTVFSESGLRNLLLDLGKKRILEDRALAAKLSREIRDLISLHSSEDEHSLFHLQASSEVLSNLPKETQWILFKTALELDLISAHEMTNSDHLDNCLFEARQMLLEQDNSLVSWPNEEQYSDHLTVRENLLFGRTKPSIYGGEETINQTLTKILDRHNLLDTVILLGMEFQVGDQGKFLSGGQRQKVSLARTFLKRPEILLLDEATASLDEISQKKVVEALDQEFPHSTRLTISHRLSTIRNHDVIFVMDRGQIVQQGKFDDLVNQPGLFAKMVKIEDRTSSDSPSVPDTITSKVPLSDPNGGGQPIINSLRMCPLFDGLSFEQLTLLVRQSKEVECPIGTVLFERGDSGTDLMVIMEGEVEFFVPSSNGDRVISTAGEGTSFGELALLGDPFRTVGARAHTHLKLCMLSRERVIELIEADSNVALELLRSVAQRVAQLAEELYGISPLTEA